MNYRKVVYADWPVIDEQPKPIDDEPVPPDPILVDDKSQPEPTPEPIRTRDSSLPKTGDTSHTMWWAAAALASLLALVIIITDEKARERRAERVNAEMEGDRNTK